ncbi:MAG: DUF4350 domain-containing protein [Planctomycetota bacterium]|jgi:hypothetical protein
MSELPDKESPGGRRLRRRGRRLLVTIVAVFFTIYVLLQLVSPWLRESERERNAGTSVGGAPEGFRAAFELLGSLGYETARWTRSYGSLPDPSRHVLVMLDPAPELAREQGDRLAAVLTDRLVDWVADGGVLVFAPQGAPVVRVFGADVVTEDERRYLPRFGDGLEALQDALFEDLPMRSLPQPPEGELRGQSSLAGFEHRIRPLPDGVAETLRSYVALKSLGRPAGILLFGDLMDGTVAPEEGWVPLASIGNRPLLVWRRHGEGAVYASSSCYPFTNAALRHAGTGLVVAEVFSVASDDGARTILFDEFAHGMDADAGVLHWVRTTSLGRVFWTILIFVGVLVWWGAVRFGRPRPPRTVPRRSKEEYVVSLADLYARGRRRRMAARSIVEGLGHDIAAVRGGSERTAGLAHELDALRAEVEADPPDSDKELLAVAREACEEHRRALRRFRGNTE